jgi:ubiquinone/menaquinone biosynthesis C-methylase UbiE
MPEITLYIPGWGYPAPSWSQACGEEKSDWSWGYFEEPKESLPNKNFGIVVHSFGLYLIPQTLLEKADRVIWYGGFFNAPPFSYETWQSGQRNPRAVIKKFMKRMYFPHPSEMVSQELNVEKLLIDLQRITFFDYNTFWKNQNSLSQKIICVFGADDLIAKPDVSLPRNKHNNPLILPGEGHMPNAKNKAWKRCLTRLLNAPLTDDPAPQRVASQNKPYDNAFSLHEGAPQWKRKVAGSFSKASQSYEKTANVQEKAADFLAKQIARHIGQLSSVLELGAGTGFLTRRILQKFQRVPITAVDLSHSMLYELEKNFSAMDRKHIFPYVADMDEFKDGKKHSLICSSFSLQWSANPLLLLSSSAHFLEPGGYIAHILPIQGSLRSLSFGGYLRPIPQLSLSMENLVESVTSFDVLQAETFELHQEFENPLAALRHIKSFGGHKGSSLQSNRLFIRKHDQPIICEWCIGCLIAKKKCLQNY